MILGATSSFANKYDASREKIKQHVAQCGSGNTPHVVSYACITCNYAQPKFSILEVPESHGVQLQNLSIATEKDTEPNVNIIPFKTCTLTGEPCNPEPVTDVWINTLENTTITVGEAALSVDSWIACTKGGKIAILTSGQEVQSLFFPLAIPVAYGVYELLCLLALLIGGIITIGMSQDIISSWKSSARSSTTTAGAASGNSGSVTEGSKDDLSQDAQDSYDDYEKNNWEHKTNKTPGTKDNKKYKNKDGKLPTKDSNGDDIEYREHDVNDKIAGQNRDGERFVSGSDGSIYYTDDHYDTFTKVK